MDHRVPTCDFLFLIMRSTYYSLGLTKWGEHPQQQQELKTMRPYEKVKFEALGLSYREAWTWNGMRGRVPIPLS